MRTRPCIMQPFCLQSLVCVNLFDHVVLFEMQCHFDGRYISILENFVIAKHPLKSCSRSVAISSYSGLKVIVTKFLVSRTFGQLP